jgi:DNA-binding CsgD family transcriptional regulator
LEDSPALACRWWLETWLVRVRWCVVPLCLAPLLHSPTVSRPLTILIALGLGLGNAGIGRLIRGEPSRERLCLVYRLATALEWAVTLAAIVLQSHDPARATPALLLLRLPADGVRYGLPGVARAAFGSVLIIGALATAQVRVLAVLPAAVALRAGLLWAEVVAVMALIVGGLLLVGGRWRRAEAALRRSEHEAWLRGERARLDSEHETWLARERARLDSDRAALRRLQYGLSEREFEVLQLLADAKLTTFGQIGARCNITADTVKTHVQRIARKLGVPGRRWAVVEAARERGLLTTTSESPKTGE